MCHLTFIWENAGHYALKFDRGLLFNNFTGLYLFAEYDVNNRE